MSKIKITTITEAQQFNVNKPRYNGYACGHGSHKDKTKYDRKYNKHQLYKMMREARKEKPF